jgi:hypothetical protein
LDGILLRLSLGHQSDKGIGKLSSPHEHENHGAEFCGRLGGRALHLD